MTTALTIDIVDALGAYRQHYGPPSGPAEVLEEALDAGRPVVSRYDLPVHVTCGVIAVGPGRRALQVRHRALGRWLFPGGHLEPSDADLVSAAIRELDEETGLSLTGDDVRRLPVGIDVHAIAANERKGEPEHYHADFRYLAEVPAGGVRLQAEEVTDWRWADPDDLDHHGLAARIRSTL